MNANVLRHLPPIVFFRSQENLRNVQEVRPAHGGVERARYGADRRRVRLEVSLVTPSLLLPIVCSGKGIARIYLPVRIKLTRTDVFVKQRSMMMHRNAPHAVFIPPVLGMYAP